VCALSPFTEHLCGFIQKVLIEFLRKLTAFDLPVKFFFFQKDPSNLLINLLEFSFFFSSIKSGQMVLNLDHE